MSQKVVPARKAHVDFPEIVVSFLETKFDFLHDAPLSNTGKYFLGKFVHPFSRQNTMKFDKFNLKISLFGIEMNMNMHEAEVFTNNFRISFGLIYYLNYVKNQLICGSLGLSLNQFNSKKINAARFFCFLFL